MKTSTNSATEPNRPTGRSRRAPHGENLPVVRGVVDYLGGPLGAHAGAVRPGWWTLLRTLIFTALVFLSFGYLSKARCLEGVRSADGVVNLNWAGNRQYVAACYNDIIPLYKGRGLNEPGFIYNFSWQEGDLTRYIEYPVLTSLFQNLMGFISRSTYGVLNIFGEHSIPEASWYFSVTALVLSALWVVTLRMVADMVGNRHLDAFLVAASPIVIVHAFSNWDILSIFFAVAGMYAVMRRKTWLGGIMFGLGTAAKMWPLFILGAFLVLAFRCRAWAPFAQITAGAAGAWLVLNVPIMLAFPEAWREFNRLNTERGWEWTTIYAIASRNLGWTGFDSGDGAPTILNAVTLLLFLGSCLAIFLLGIKAPHTPRVAELVLLILIAFLLFNKVWSPQYSIWLVIPAVLAVPRWRLLISWMITEMLVWPALMWHMLGTDKKGVPGEFLDLVLLCRDGFLIALAVIVIRQMYGKTADKVRDAHEGRDPLAGPFRPRVKVASESAI
nr:glycosyltransferase 87 family protein [Corynebacterium incognita]